MNRWHAANDPQHTLPGSAACAFGTRRVYSENISKPATGEAPPSA